MPAPSYDNRQQRLAELADQWGVQFPPSLPPMTRPSHPPSFRTPDDDYQAEELVKRRQLSHGKTESTGNLRKAFSSSKKKTYDPSVIFSALNAHVANCGSPGVAEALINLLLASGGDLNLPQKPKSGLLSRRRSLETFGERSKLLQQAVQNGHVDMIQILLPQADTLALDTSLPMAMRSQSLTITDLLLRYGAGTASTADAQDAFRQACATGGQPELVGLILRSEGRPSMSWVSQCMVDAARAGCLDTVLQLSRSTADGGFNQAEALKVALAQGRQDIALAIVMGSRPPHGQGLNEAFTSLMDNPSVNPNDKLSMAEMLLCAGAEGDAPAAVLLNASSSEFLEILQLLVYYGASIEYRDAMAVRKAVKNGRVDVAHILLNGNSALSSMQASECVELIPKDLATEHRRLLLETLLRKGASGTPLHEMLIEAAEAGDVESVMLLLTPQFPGGRAVESRTLARRPSKSMIFERHEVASVDYKGGLALQIAVRRGDLPMTRAMLDGKPSQATRTAVFEQVRSLSSPDRYKMTEVFLDGGMPSATIQKCLQDAIDDKPPHRDEHLIALFLKHTTDVTSSDGAIAAAVMQKDIKLLAAFLKKKINPQIAANVLPIVMATKDPRARLEMTSLILSTVHGMDPARVSSALIHVLKGQPADLRLIQVLLQQGRADINAEDGLPLALAISDHEPPVLDLLLKYGRAMPATINRGLNELSHLPSSEKKAAKLQFLLSRTDEKALFNDILVKEVRSLLKLTPEERVLSIVRVLLSSGADVNAHNAGALCHAIAASDQQLTDILFTDNLTPASLACALPHALSISDPMDRLQFSKRLLDAGAPSAEANRALGFAINTYADDIPLLRTLSTRANTMDGEALVAAVKRERPDIVDLVLQRKHSQSVLNTAFVEATKCKNRETRVLICTLLLRNGASGSVVSNALQAAAADGDLALGNMLVTHGVAIDEAAILGACRSGAADVLKMLLGGTESPGKDTLERGFQAATEVGDLKKRAAILEPLLARGVGGDAVNAQLVSAVRYGSDGDDMVRILLRNGADPNYSDGEAVWASTRSAYVGSLRMLLGVDGSENLKIKPTEATLKRALNASWKLSNSRLEVLNLIFRAGLPACQELDLILHEAVNEEVTDEKAIDLLVTQGASPSSNGCKSLIEATKKGMLPVLKLLLGADMALGDLDLAVKQSFVKDNSQVWFTDKGFLMLQSYLDKGARGGTLSGILADVLDLASTNPELADRFTDLLFDHEVDVDYQDGRLLESATSAGNLVLIKRLLERRPSAESLSRAFYRVFDRQVAEEQALELVSLFTDYADGEVRLDVMQVVPGTPPILFLALSQYPRSTKMAKTLLDAGYYHDQTTVCRVMPEIEQDETVTLLAWALLQPQKKISSGILELLIRSGAKVNFETTLSRVTPLMLAIQARRPDIAKILLLEGAEVDVADAKGNTPLAMATDIGGDIATTMMSNLLAAGASKNDGSLHNAARELNIAAVQVLVEYGHDPDFPSHIHDGRSALGEVCLHAADSGELTGLKEKQVERLFNILIDAGSDITLKTGGKSILHLSLESRDPMATSRLLLKVGMWKHINKKFNLFSDGTHTYSPTMYVAKVLQPTDLRDQLLTLLRANRCDDVYYANTGTQPEDAIGLPDDLELQERERRARLDRIATDAEDHKISLARSRELAAVQAKIWSDQAELEDARRRRLQADDASALVHRARAEEEAFALAARRRKAERVAEVNHDRQLAEAATARSRQESELEERRHAKALDYERRIATERVDHAKALSALRIAEREDVERLDKKQDERLSRRISEQRRLVDSQTGLAGQLASGGVNGRKQIGYVMGETT